MVTLALILNLIRYRYNWIKNIIQVQHCTEGGLGTVGGVPVPVALELGQRQDTATILLLLVAAIHAQDLLIL